MCIRDRDRKESLLAYKAEHGSSIADLDMQLAFLCHELETKFPHVLEKLKNASSVREASDYVLFHFEAPADQGESVQAQRAAYGAGYVSYTHLDVYKRQVYRSGAAGQLCGGGTGELQSV